MAQGASWDIYKRWSDPVWDTWRLNNANCHFLTATMKEHNKQEFYGSRDTLIEMGYSPCGICNP